LKRKSEYFGNTVFPTLNSYANTPPMLIKQERDWTCSVACIRTILSAFKEYPSEDSFISKFELIPGPHYTEEILAKKMFGENKKIISCYDYPESDLSISLLNQLLNEKYFIMAECMYNYAHWVVLLGYFVVRDRSDPEESYILFYDPYYDEPRLVRADEFQTMWCDPDGHKSEFIAVKAI